MFNPQNSKEQVGCGKHTQSNTSSPHNRRTRTDASHAGRGNTGTSRQGGTICTLRGGTISTLNGGTISTLKRGTISTVKGGTISSLKDPDPDPKIKSYFSLCLINFAL